MKAVLCKAYGPPESLVLDEVADPTPGAGQVMIDVRSCGINFPDVLMIENKYQFRPPLPFAPGGEVAGVIAALGAGVSGFAPGQRVLAMTGWGGFAEKVLAPATSVVPIPDAMDFETASAFLMTYGTSHYALTDRGHLRAGETLAVLGASGGVGLAAVELGKAAGARVIACASSPEKLEVCRAHGADEGIDYSREDLKARLKELTQGAGVDVVYDPVGGELAEAAIRSMAWEGRFLVIGFTAGIPRVPLNLTLLKSCDIVGVFWGAFTARNPARHREHIGELFELWSAGKLRPLVSKRFRFNEAAAALREISERRVHGKVVLVP